MSPKQTNIRQQYKTINIPSDCESDPERRFDLAIQEARERFQDYCTPATWTLVKDDGENVTVKRTTFKHFPTTHAGSPEIW